MTKRSTYVKWIVATAVALGIFCYPAASQTNSPPTTSAKSGACNQPAKKPITFLELPGKPFEPIPTADGCWIFVSVTSPARLLKPGIGVVKRSAGKLSLKRMVHIGPGATGMVLTHDGKILIVAENESLVFLDSARMISGHSDAVIGKISDGPNAGSIYVNVTADDHFLFVSDERAEAITVIDLEKARNSGFSVNSVVGRIPVGRAPIALTFSSDERFLYTTSEFAQKEWGWPEVCTPEGDDKLPNWKLPEGAIIIVDVAHAKTDPAKSVVRRIPAGCSPVRLEISSKGDRAYVSARNDNALLVFDTNKLHADPNNALVATVPVGSAPVGVALVDKETYIVVTNSNRFLAGPTVNQNLTVIDAAKVSSGSGAILGTIPAGVFPRELRLTADGRTLLLTNFNSNTLEVIDLARLPIQSPGK